MLLDINLKAIIIDSGLFLIFCRMCDGPNWNSIDRMVIVISNTTIVGIVGVFLIFTWVSPSCKHFWWPHFRHYCLICLLQQIFIPFPHQALSLRKLQHISPWNSTISTKFIITIWRKFPLLSTIRKTLHVK